MPRIFKGVSLFKTSVVVISFLAGITGFRDAVWKEYRLLQFRDEEVGVSTRICRCLFQAQNYNFCQQQLNLNLNSLITVNIQQHSRAFRFPPYFFYCKSVTGLDFYALGWFMEGSWSKLWSW